MKRAILVMLLCSTVLPVVASAPTPALAERPAPIDDRQSDPEHGLECSGWCIELSVVALCHFRDWIARDCQSSCEEYCGEDGVAKAELECGLCTCTCS